MALPIARHTGIRNSSLCSRTLASAIALCSLTTSIRCGRPSRGRLSSICSMISAPSTLGCAKRIGRVVRLFERNDGHGLGVALVDIFCTASSTCGAIIDVSPVYHTVSPVATTAVASRLSSDTVFERLSNVSWPLTASITHLRPRLNGHAHAVALDQPPAFVGDRVGRAARVEPAGAPAA